MSVIEYRICSSALGTENLNNNVFITQLLRFFIFTETVLNPFSLFYIDIKIVSVFIAVNSNRITDSADCTQCLKSFMLA